MTTAEWGALDDDIAGGQGDDTVALVRWQGKVAAICSYDPVHGLVHSVVSTRPGLGLGTAALRAAEADMRARGVRAAVIDEITPSATRFYVKLGYTVRPQKYPRYPGALTGTKAL